MMQVVGAGRGPLVKAALRASKTTKRPLKVFAVEKVRINNNNDDDDDDDDND